MTPPILTAMGPLLERYDVLFSDVWGVVHDGNRAHPAACDALARFRARGGTVILITNAPQPADRVAEILDEKAVGRDAWDDIVSSGEIALESVKSRGFSTVYHIGPPKRSRPLMSRLPGLTAHLDAAEAIVCSGLVDDRRETAEDYRDFLQRAHVRKLPFICANPDLAVHVGDDLLPCAGAIATLYAELGGEVIWAGKPHPPAYASALAKAEALRGRPCERSRILAIGDALRTDLAGAEAASIDALFIASGIHRHEAMAVDAVDPAGLARLFQAGAPRAVAASAALAW